MSFGNAGAYRTAMRVKSAKVWWIYLWTSFQSW